MVMRHRAVSLPHKLLHRPACGAFSPAYLGELLGLARMMEHERHMRSMARWIPGHSFNLADWTARHGLHGHDRDVRNNSAASECSGTTGCCRRLVWFGAAALAIGTLWLSERLLRQMSPALADVL